MFLWKYEFTSTSIIVLQLPDSDSKIVEAGDNYIQNIFDSEKTTVENKTLSTKFRPIRQKIGLLTHKRKRDVARSQSAALCIICCIFCCVIWAWNVLIYRFHPKATSALSSLKIELFEESKNPGNENIPAKFKLFKIPKISRSMMGIFDLDQFQAAEL